MNRQPGFGSDRRLAGLAATALVHLALMIGWQMARQAPPALPDDSAEAVQWLHLPAPQSDTTPVAAPTAQPPRKPAAPAAVRKARPVDAAIPAQAAAAPTPSAAPAETGPAPAPAPAIDRVLERARRSAGDIDRALRKERQPTIVLPPDSPQIRMQQRMEEARSLAPPRSWEAPKVEELVNNTGDGARRTRVITGRGTYCITERSPATSIDMIEKHGKQRFTTCPRHEEPAKRQQWRTARD